MSSARNSDRKLEPEGEEMMIFSAPCPTGHLAVTQVLLPRYGPKALREGDVDTLNNDADYDSDDVVGAGESTVVRRLRFFRTMESSTSSKTADADGSGAGAGEGSAAAKELEEAKSYKAMTALESVSDYLQTEMLVHIHLPPEALPSSTSKSILSKSLLVRSTLRMSYHRLFVACCALTPHPFFYTPPRRGRGGMVDDEFVDHRVVLVAGLGGGAFPQYLLSVSRKRRMCVEVVERDAGVVAVARRFFGLIESPKLRIHQDDARSFLPKAYQSEYIYDMIFIDIDGLTPDGKNVIAPPLELTSVEFLETIFHLLDDDGVAVFNVLYDTGDKTASDRFLGDFVYNCCQVFAGVVVLLTVEGSNNRIVACWTDPQSGTRSFELEPGKVIQTLGGADLTKRIKKLARGQRKLRELMVQTRIGLLPVREVLSRRSQPKPDTSSSSEGK